MKFGSWTYDGYKLDLVFYDGSEEVDVNDYIESNEWVLVEHPAIRNVKRYPCCEEPYIDLTFTLKVKRMGAFYSYILILPCVLLSSITLVIFWLPPESSAKMILGEYCTNSSARTDNVLPRNTTTSTKLSNSNLWRTRVSHLMPTSYYDVTRCEAWPLTYTGVYKQNWTNKMDKHHTERCLGTFSNKIR